MIEEQEQREHPSPEDVGREARQELEELDHSDEMESHRERVEELADEVDVPDPAEKSAPGVDADEVPEDQGERANEAGQ